ncbi:MULTISPECIES: hypothetical protein [Deefgea]|uniref:Uncharacterized protein n=1 Tax=Deefgea chitinilytica TaxID=570276 RepID=A0ABS2CD21_9NEIS|nr:MULTISPECIES: hypothetical protein [Deefgea]MBM5571570.1 hypothetical protein [Deefgea chitinilytica]MBM9888804.1 hypothetical protein [Deefgea sp. CFH1-16]
MGNKFETQSKIPLSINAESLGDEIVYIEEEVHSYNKQANAILFALVGKNYIESRKIRIMKGKFFSEATVRTSGELLEDADHIAENFNSKLRRFIDLTDELYAALAKGDTQKYDALIASQAAKNENGDITQFLRARMKLENPIPVGFGEIPIIVEPLEAINTTLIYDVEESAVGTIKQQNYANFEIILHTNNKIIITLKYAIEQESLIVDMAQSRKNVKIDFIKKTQTIGAKITRMSGELLHLTPIDELNLNPESLSSGDLLIQSSNEN